MARSVCSVTLASALETPASASFSIAAPRGASAPTSARPAGVSDINTVRLSSAEGRRSTRPRASRLATERDRYENSAAVWLAKSVSDCRS